MKQETAEKIAARYHDKTVAEGHGHYHYKVCMLCGAVRFSSCSNANEPDRVSAETSDPTECDVCNEVYQRNPEMVTWFLAVLSVMQKEAILNRKTGQT